MRIAAASKLIQGQASPSTSHCATGTCKPFQVVSHFYTGAVHWQVFPGKTASLHSQPHKDRPPYAHSAAWAAAASGSSSIESTVPQLKVLADADPAKSCCICFVLHMPALSSS